MSISATHYRTLFALVLALLLGTSCSDQGSTPAPKPVSTEAPDSAEKVTEVAAPSAEQAAPEASQPAVGQKTEVISAPEKTAAADGQKIYKTYCQACHANGVAGSPKFGDKEAWAPRIAKGNDILFLSLKNGLKAMPPKGGCMTCNDDDLRAAMEYMVEQGS